VTSPEVGIAESVTGKVITALNEEAVISACLANRHGLNLVVSYEAFAVKMLGSIRQSIIFSRKLREHGITNTLIIIGVIEDPNVYVKLIEFSRFDNIMLLTEPTYTTKASEFIHYADLVVGTGRGFMEAALQGKLMLCPDNANKRLAFIDDSNIDLFFSRNFSGRYEADNDNFTSLIDILMNGDTDYKKMIIGYSDSKFSLRVGSEKYVQLYLDKPMNKLMIYDLCKHFVFFFYAKANKGGKVSAFKKMLLGK